MTLLYLIRHGLNDYVDEGRLAGWRPNVHLNETGKAQAEAIAELLKDKKFQAIYSSPLERAVETAVPLAKRQGLEVIHRDGLGEVDVGKWEGKTFKQLRRMKLWKLVRIQPSLVQFPEGESFLEAQARVVGELESLREEHSGKKRRIACFFHADPIKIAVAYYLGLPLDMFQRVVIEPASVSVINAHEGHIQVIRVNDVRASRLDG